MKNKKFVFVCSQRLWKEWSSMDHQKRCKWCNMKNPLYIEYHDKEWCKPNFEEQYLYEMLILESFQAGLSWECVLNKRESFKKAYDNFEINKVCSYDEIKIEVLHFFFFLMTIQLFQNHLLKRLSLPPLYYLGIFVKKYFGHRCTELFLELLFCSIDLFVSLYTTLSWLL